MYSNVSLPNFCKRQDTIQTRIQQKSQIEHIDRCHYLECNKITPNLLYCGPEEDLIYWTDMQSTFPLFTVRLLTYS